MRILSTRQVQHLQVLKRGDVRQQGDRYRGENVVKHVTVAENDIMKNEENYRKKQKNHNIER
jgi:hypothetical protein